MVTSEPTKDRFQTEQILTIVGGHCVHDTYSSFVAPLLPLLIKKLSLSLTLAGALWSLVQVPGLLNPFIGYLADRVNLRYLVILAPAVTATLMSLIGLAPNYLMLTTLLLGAGISVATFHAPAPAMISRISGKQLGKGMSFFMAGGEMGRTVGPLLAVWAVYTWTLEHSYPVMVFGWLASLALYLRLHKTPTDIPKAQNLRISLRALQRLFVPLLGIVIPRQMMLTALTLYLPTFLSKEGASLWLAGASLSLWELAGIGGALIGGTLSDWTGRQPVLLVSISGSCILMLVFLRTTGWQLIPVLFSLGFVGLSTGPVMLAMVQEHLPDRRAMANGLFLSMTFLARPLAALTLGLLGDHFGLHFAFFSSAVILLLAIPFIFLLPKPGILPES